MYFILNFSAFMFVTVLFLLSAKISERVTNDKLQKFLIKTGLILSIIGIFLGLDFILTTLELLTNN